MDVRRIVKAVDAQNGPRSPSILVHAREALIADFAGGDFVLADGDLARPPNFEKVLQNAEHE